MIEAVGRPVVTRNQATVGFCLCHCGIGRPFPNHGALLRLQAEAGT
jgi:maleate cis-trans isomerase